MRYILIEFVSVVLNFQTRSTGGIVVYQSPTSLHYLGNFLQLFFLTFNTELYLLLTKISQAFACTFYLFLVLLVAVMLLFILSVHWVSFNGRRFLGSEIPD